MSPYTSKNYGYDLRDDTISDPRDSNAYFSKRHGYSIGCDPASDARESYNNMQDVMEQYKAEMELRKSLYNMQQDMLQRQSQPMYMVNSSTCQIEPRGSIGAGGMIRADKLCATSMPSDATASRLCDVPMGVSQWKEHGKRYGYWDHFKNEVAKELMREKKSEASDRVSLPTDKVEIKKY